MNLGPKRTDCGTASGRASVWLKLELSYDKQRRAKTALDPRFAVNRQSRRPSAFAGQTALCRNINHLINSLDERNFGCVVCVIAANKIAVGRNA